MAHNDKKTYIPKFVIIYSIIGDLLFVIGVILYYQVCSATIEEVVNPRHPVNEPYLYGIGMIILSLVIIGGIIAVASVKEDVTEDEKKFTKGCLVFCTILLIIYLFLKGQMVLP